MSKVGDAKKKASGYLSAIRTMLDNYPQPQVSEDMNKLLSANTPFVFVMELLRICGCTPDKLLAWISKILCGQNVIKNPAGSEKVNMGNIGSLSDQWGVEKNGQGYGALDGIEDVIKVFLLTNIKNMFTCSLNPFIPDDVMKDPNKKDGSGISGNGIKIPIKSIDMFNVLSHSPCSKLTKINKKGQKRETMGSMLYFDNDYSPNEMWKSTDFNAFLWYTINRGTNTDDGEKKMIWDNRCRRWRALENSKNYSNYKDRNLPNGGLTNGRQKDGNGNPDLHNNFFNPEYGEKSYISRKGANTDYGGYPNRPPRVEGEGDNKTRPRKTERKNQEKIKKIQYFIVNYSEKGESNTGVDDYLTIWLNADRYVIQPENSSRPFRYNKTVFEFNYDFIQHIRLFDTQVIVGNVINAILGITNSAVGSILGGKFSLNEQVIRGEIGKMVKDVINSETTINECSFSFSNDDYDELLNKTQETIFNQEDIENITTSVADINNSSSMEEAQTKINDVLTKVADFELSKNGDVEVSDLFSFGQNIILKIIEECIIQIVLQVLGPKVMLVFAVNAYFMGDITDVNDFEPKSFLIGMHNLIFTIVKQLYEMILKQLIQFLIDEIRPLITLMIEKLLLERVRFYIDLLKRLLALIKMFYNAFNNKKTISAIDNVNYADIVPVEDKPETETC